MTAPGPSRAAGSEVDSELVDAATEAVRSVFRPGWHFVGAALRGASGAIHTGVNLQAYVTRISVCAEPVALGKAVLAQEPGLVQAVAVFHPAEAGSDPVVCSPCGMCREILGDYAPDLEVVVPGEDRPVVAAIADLLPNKYRRAG